jgi:hypothetical protein
MIFEWILLLEIQKKMKIFGFFWHKLKLLFFFIFEILFITFANFKNYKNFIFFNPGF